MPPTNNTSDLGDHFGAGNETRTRDLKLAEFDAGAGDTRLILILILTQDQIIDLLHVFPSDTTNEAKLVDQIETHVNKIVELGFLRRMKGPAGTTTIADYLFMHTIVCILRR